MEINIQASQITEKTWFISKKCLKEKLIKGVQIGSFFKYFRIRKPS